MILPLEISPVAAEQLLDACLHYDRIREGLGDEFEAEVENTFGLILKNPDAFSYYRKPFRQAALGRFPYVVVYEVRSNAVFVASIFNTHQDPDKKLPGTKF